MFYSHFIVIRLIIVVNSGWLAFDLVQQTAVQIVSYFLFKQDKKKQYVKKKKKKTISLHFNVFFFYLLLLQAATVSAVLWWPWWYKKCWQCLEFAIFFFIFCFFSFNTPVIIFSSHLILVEIRHWIILY